MLTTPNRTADADACSKGESVPEPSAVVVAIRIGLQGKVRALRARGHRATTEIAPGVTGVRRPSAAGATMSSASSSQPIGNTASKSCNKWGKFTACYHIFDTALAFTPGANHTRGRRRSTLSNSKNKEKTVASKYGWVGGAWIFSAAVMGSAAYD
jgi:hypothetical protein